MDQEIKELLQVIVHRLDGMDARLTTLEEGQRSMDARLTSLEQGQKDLSSKLDRYYEGTIEAVGNGLEVIGNKIDDVERNLTNKINDIESVTAQNAYDVQLMKRRA